MSIAPGEVLVIYGSNIGASQLTAYQLTGGGLVSTTLAGTSVYMNGAPSPILYTSPNQVSAIVPFGITSSSAQDLHRQSRAKHRAGDRQSRAHRAGRFHAEL